MWKVAEDYSGLQFEDVPGSIYLDDQSVLVKSEIASRQHLAEAGPTPDPDPADSEDEETDEGTEDEGGGGTNGPDASRPKRFYGSVDINPVRASRDAQEVINEVVQHLAGQSNSNVTVTIDIQATFTDGVPEELQRILTENCRTLGFNAQEFEEE